jgi:hypothetical protein
MHDIITSQTVRIATISGRYTFYIKFLPLEGSTKSRVSLFLARDIAIYHFCDHQNKFLNFIPALIWNDMHTHTHTHTHNIISFLKMKIHGVNKFRSHWYLLIIVAILRSAQKHR